MDEVLLPAPYGYNESVIETSFFRTLNFETNVIPTKKSDRDYEPMIGSVTVVVKLGGVGSLTETIKTYEIKDAKAKDISTKLKDRFDTNNYKIVIPELEELKEKVHKDELSKFVKGLETFEKSFSK